MDTINIMLDDGAFMPTRAYETDAGLDIRTPHAFTVPANGSKVIDTGVHVQIPRGYYGAITSKSGLAINHNITSVQGTIDCGFNGSIKVKAKSGTAGTARRMPLRSSRILSRYTILSGMLRKMQTRDSGSYASRTTGMYGRRSL